MSEYVITVNSTVDLPKEWLEERHVPVFPLKYTIEDKTYEDMSGLSSKEFFQKLREGKMATTTQINPEQAKESFEPLLKEGKDILHLGFSSGLSGTYNSMRIAAEELKEEYPDRKIRVLNSRGASLGEGLIVLAAAKLAAEGRVIEEIEVRCEELCGKMRQHFMVDELKFLRKGGRISGGAALAGTLLQIKPILEGDEEGKIVMLSKVRGKKAGIEELVKLYDQMVEDRSAPVGISHAGSPADALVVATKLRQVGCTGEILTVCHEPVTGAHVGPGMLAVYFYSEIWR